MEWAAAVEASAAQVSATEGAGAEDTGGLQALAWTTATNALFATTLIPAALPDRVPGARPTAHTGRMDPELARGTAVPPKKWVLGAGLFF